MNIDLSNAQPGGSDPCKVYRYLANRLPEGDQLLPALMKLEAVDGAFRICLPAQSTLVLTQL